MSDWSSGPFKISVGVPAPRRDAAADRSTLQAMLAATQALDYARAGELATEALATGLTHPLAFNLAALKLETEGKVAEAAELLDKAVALAPKDLGARQALGLILLRLERHAAALDQFDHVTADHPKVAAGHAGRGLALEALGRLTEAVAAHTQALELQPENLSALSGMANLASRRGAHAEARALAGRVLATQPNYPDAVMVAAAADIAEALPDRAILALDALLADPRPTPAQRGLALGLKGDALDAAQDAPAAFAAYQAGNAALAEAYAQPWGGPPSALAFANAMLQELAAIPDAAWPSQGPPPPEATGHVFLLGFPRSGTTLLEQVLAGHPQVEALEERETLAEATRAFLSRPSDLGRLPAATQAQLEPLRVAYWARVKAEGADPAAKVFVDKHPLNTFRLPLIASLFPGATVLMARRDPRDVVLSAFRRRFVMSGAAYQMLTLEGVAAYYDAAMRLARRFEAILGHRLHVVRHERLIEDFDGVSREVCAVIGLPWTEGLGDFARRLGTRGVATPSAAQLSRGLSAEGVGAWRRYAEQMAPVLPVLAPWVERFGYPET